MIVYREARRGSRASLCQPSPRRGAHVRALSVRLVSLRLPRVPSGVVSRADRARAHRPKLFFALSKRHPELRSSVSQFCLSERQKTCRRFVCHVSGRLCSCFSGKQSPDSPSPNRRLRMLSFPARGEAFFSKGPIFGGIFRARVVCPRSLEIPSERSRNIFFDSTAKQVAASCGLCDSTRARGTPHTHRRR